MKTLKFALKFATFFIALAATVCHAQAVKSPLVAPSAAAATAKPVEVPIGKEFLLGMELVDRQAKEANDALEKLKGIIMSPLQAQYNSLISDACKAAGFEITECSYDPAKKSLKKIEPQAAKPPAK